MMLQPQQARALMFRSLQLAQKAQAAGDVPVGALVVRTQDAKVIAEGYSQRESLQCATQHAEIVAIQAACRSLGSWRLDGCSLVVTLEPCLMCAGAIMQSRMDSIVYGAPNSKNGAFGSLYALNRDARLNHAMPVVGGIEAGYCRHQLNEFFKSRRRSKPKRPPPSAVE